jgi:hypothetical protein
MLSTQIYSDPLKIITAQDNPRLKIKQGQVFTGFSPGFHRVFTGFSPGFHQVFTRNGFQDLLQGFRIEFRIGFRLNRGYLMSSWGRV